MIINNKLLFSILWDSMGMITIHHLRFIILSNSYVCPHHGVIQAEQALGWDSRIPSNPHALSHEFPHGAELPGISLKYPVGNCLIAVHTDILTNGRPSGVASTDIDVVSTRGFYRASQLADQHAKLLEEGSFCFCFSVRTGLFVYLL